MLLHMSNQNQHVESNKQSAFAQLSETGVHNFRKLMAKSSKAADLFAAVAGMMDDQGCLIASRATLAKIANTDQTNIGKLIKMLEEYAVIRKFAVKGMPVIAINPDVTWRNGYTYYHAIFVASKDEACEPEKTDEGEGSGESAGDGAESEKGDGDGVSSEGITLQSVKKKLLEEWDQKDDELRIMQNKQHKNIPRRPLLPWRWNAWAKHVEAIKAENDHLEKRITMKRKLITEIEEQIKRIEETDSEEPKDEQKREEP